MRGSFFPDAGVGWQPFWLPFMLIVIWVSPCVLLIADDTVAVSAVLVCLRCDAMGRLTVQVGLVADGGYDLVGVGLGDGLGRVL